MNKKYSGILFVGTGLEGKIYGWKDLEGFKEIEQPKVSYADYNFVIDTLKRLSGNMLTLVEASIQDKEQRKALKDIIKGFFSEEMNHVSDLMFSREEMDSIIKTAEETAPTGLTPIDVEEIIRS